MRPIDTATIAFTLSLLGSTALAAENGPAMQSVLDFAAATDSGVEIKWDNFQKKDDVEIYTGVTMGDGHSQMDIAALVLKQQEGGLLSLQGKGLHSKEDGMLFTADTLLATVRPDKLLSLADDPDLLVTDFCDTFGDQAAMSIQDMLWKSTTGNDSFEIAEIKLGVGTSTMAGSCIADLFFNMTDLNIDSEDAKGVISEVSMKSFGPASYQLPSEKTGLQFETTYTIRGVDMHDQNGGSLKVSKISATGDSAADSMIALGSSSLMQAMSKAEEAQLSGQPLAGDPFADISFTEVWNAAIEASGKSSVDVEGLEIIPGANLPLPPALGSKFILDAALELNKKAEYLEFKFHEDLVDTLASSIGLTLKMERFPDGAEAAEDPLAFASQIPLYLVSAQFMFDDKGLDERLRASMGMGITNAIDMAGIPTSASNLELAKAWLDSSNGDAPPATLSLTPPAPLLATSLIPMVMGDWKPLAATLGAR